MTKAQIVSETKGGLLLAWRALWQICVFAVSVLFGYAVLYGNTLWMGEAEVEATIENKLNSAVFPRIQQLESHAKDQNLHFAFDERRQFPTREEIRDLKDELRRLNDKLDGLR